MAKTRKKTQSAKGATDTLPVLTLIVDAELGIQALNGAARAFLGSEPEKALRMRQGDAFHCAHSKEAPAGCGHGRFCQMCPIREAAVLAWSEQRVVRRRTKVEAETPGGTREVHMLVTATPIPSPGSARILLVLEDINDLVELQKPVPICAACRRIRDDDHYWEQLEVHFRQHLDLDLSHGVCAECSQRLYGDVLASQPLQLKPRPASLKQR